MKRMKGIWMLWGMVGGMSLLVGCGARRLEAREAERVAATSSVRISSVEAGERVTERDSVMAVRAPVEVSRNVTEDSSFVQTSLAWSVAVWKDGRLNHSIGNFPFIPAPVRTVVHERWKVCRDTLVVTDTVRVTETVRQEVVKPASWWDRWWSAAGKIMIVIIAGYVAWRKLKPK